MKLKLLVEHMRFRWLILFFFFGLLGVIAINFLTSTANFSYRAYSRPSDPSAASPQRSPSPSLPLPEKVVSAERSIADALARLPNGEVYHNVPEEMQVGVSETIEAGIASKVTGQIKKRLQGRGDIDIEPGVRFDPSGMKMDLVTRPDEFEVFEVKGGEQFVTASIPGKWIWRVKPLKAGDNLIAIKATVKLKVPALNITRPVETESGSELSLLYQSIRSYKLERGSWFSSRFWLIG